MKVLKSVLMVFAVGVLAINVNAQTAKSTTNSKDVSQDGKTTTKVQTTTTSKVQPKTKSDKTTDKVTTKTQTTVKK